MTIRVVRSWMALLVLIVSVGVQVPGAPPAGAEPVAKASITFDVATGRVVSAHDARTPHPVASTIKLLTALIVRANVPMDDEVPITRQAADVSPLKLTMEPGSRWRADHLLHSMLIASLNDAAVALAIHAGGGSLDGFHTAVAAEARRLGLADDPEVSDPSGLDGEDSVAGDNLISARDLGIVTRAFLGDPVLAEIAKMPSYHFDGGDDRPHVVYSHNAFLTIYPGAIGVKTGYTDHAGNNLVAAATRDGRTFATVVIDSPDPVAYASARLDAAFGAPADAAGTGDVLPDAGVTPAPVEGATTPQHPVSFSVNVPPVTEREFASWSVIGIAGVGVMVLATMTGRVRRRLRSTARPRRARR